MAEKLVIISDMWGCKKGLWITSYLVYLQQFYDITFYDCLKLANINLTVNSDKNIHTAFVEGGIDTAIAHLLKKETEPAHYLAFSTGGTIAWKASLQGLPMKSLYTISSTRIRKEENCPDCKTTILFGDQDIYKPKQDWYAKMGLESQLIKGFGHELYTDEKNIQKICLDLLRVITHKSNPELSESDKVA